MLLYQWASAPAIDQSEEFNNFVQWLFFGGEGLIEDSEHHEQRKIFKYNQLKIRLKGSPNRPLNKNLRVTSRRSEFLVTRCTSAF